MPDETANEKLLDLAVRLIEMPEDDPLALLRTKVIMACCVKIIAEELGKCRAAHTKTATH